MKRSTRWLCLAALLGAAAAGCGGGNTNVSVSISPTTATVLVSSSNQFTATVNGSSNTVLWSINGLTAATSTTPSGNGTIGTVDSTGVYTAPATVPANTTITVTASVQSTTATASATITLDSGVRVTITPNAFTIGTGEQYEFNPTVTITGISSTASVSGTCVATGASNPTNLPLCSNGVTWSVTGGGTINATTGHYTATGAAATSTVTATSVYDTTETATATVTILSATDPTITSISPTAGAIGARFQYIYLTGTNFISTTNVFINGSLVPSNDVAVSASAAVATTLRVQVPDIFLANAGASTFTVSRQGGAQKSCPTATASQCVLTLVPVRPAIVGASPDSIPQGTGATIPFTIDGGYFGPPSNPSVTVRFAGQPTTPSISTTNPDQQLSVTVPGAAASVPGLYPVEVDSNSPGLPPAMVNLAVQPTYSGSFTPLTTSLPLGTTPTAVAVNTNTGIAVVVNQGSNDIALIDMTQATPAVLGFVCTGTVGATLTPTESGACAVSGPNAVAVDNLRNLALVANGTSNTVAVVNLAGAPQAITALLPAPTFNNGNTSPVTLIPSAVGINPVTGRAIVAFRTSANLGTNAALLYDLTQSTPALIGPVTVSNGPNVHIAVSPKLNWAFVTPGGLGSLSIVDLGKENVSSLTANGVSRTGGVSTVTTASTNALQVGQPVSILGVTDNSFNGFYSVVSVPSSTTFTYAQALLPNTANAVGGGTVSYAPPLATIATNLSVSGIGFNDETEKALFVDPTGAITATVLNVLDATSTSVNIGQADKIGMSGAAINPLANIGMAVNKTSGNATLIDPVSAAILATFPVGAQPVDVAFDPGTNRAIVIDQGTTPGTASVVSLGSLRNAPQILQSNVQIGSNPLTTAAPQVTINSTLTSTATAQNQTITVIGTGFTSGSVAQLDGTTLSTTVAANGRSLTALVPASLQTGPRRYALQVLSSGVASNASIFTVVQSVDVRSSNGCTAPAPQGVAVDSTNALAVISEPGGGCNSVALLDLTTGTAKNPSQPLIAVGTNPTGVATLPQFGVAVVANTGSNTASVVDEINGNGVIATITTDAVPSGVAMDLSTGTAIVAASGANLIDTFAVPTTASSGVSTPATQAVGQSPVGVAVDPTRHWVAVGNVGSNSISIVDLTGTNTTTTASGVTFPEGIVFDPVSANFLVASASSNTVDILNPSSTALSAFRVGINPTSLAYNFAASTLVTTNSASSTMTVVDSLDQSVRAVFPLTPSDQFAVDIYPLTNLAVVADTTNNRVLLIPLPR